MQLALLSQFAAVVHAVPVRGTSQNGWVSVTWLLQKPEAQSVSAVQLAQKSPVVPVVPVVVPVVPDVVVPEPLVVPDVWPGHSPEVGRQYEPASAPVLLISSAVHVSLELQMVVAVHGTPLHQVAPSESWTHTPAPQTVSSLQLTHSLAVPVLPVVPAVVLAVVLAVVPAVVPLVVLAVVLALVEVVDVVPVVLVVDVVPVVFPTLVDVVPVVFVVPVLPPPMVAASLPLVVVALVANTHEPCSQVWVFVHAWHDAPFTPQLWVLLLWQTPFPSQQPAQFDELHAPLLVPLLPPLVEVVVLPPFPPLLPPPNAHTPCTQSWAPTQAWQAAPSRPQVLAAEA